MGTFLTFSAGICSIRRRQATWMKPSSSPASPPTPPRKTERTARSSTGTASSSSRRRRSALRFGNACAQTIYALTAAVDAKDHYTFNHSENVSLYASKLAEEIGLDREHVEFVRQAGLLHDIGKIGVLRAHPQQKGPADQGRDADNAGARGRLHRYD